MPVSRELFRAISSSFPTGVVIIATLDDHGQPKGLTSQAYVGLSTEPPLMLVSIDRASRTLFASKADDKFKDVSWDPSPEAGGAPILRGLSLAYAACRVTEIYDGGDHVMFIGSVEAGEALGGTPLMYYKRAYAAWPEERPAPPVEGTS